MATAASRYEQLGEQFGASAQQQQFMQEERAPAPAMQQQPVHAIAIHTGAARVPEVPQGPCCSRRTSVIAAAVATALGSALVLILLCAADGLADENSMLNKPGVSTHGVRHGFRTKSFVSEYFPARRRFRDMSMAACTQVLSERPTLAASPLGIFRP